MAHGASQDGDGIPDDGSFLAGGNMNMYVELDVGAESAHCGFGRYTKDSLRARKNLSHDSRITGKISEVSASSPPRS